MVHRSRRLILIRCFLGAVFFLASASGPLPMPQPADAAKYQALIPDFPSVTQWYNLSCEYAAAASVTLYWGNLVSQKDFVREVPSSPNPHLGFRGSINGTGGGI